MEFAPSFPVSIALLLSVLLPFLLFLVPRVAPRSWSPATQFFCATAGAVFFWGTLVATQLQIATADRVLWLDIVSGAFILATAILALFSAWTLISHGYTISMLITIAQHEQSLSLDEWMSLYGSGRGLESLLHDRLQVLIKFGLVEIRGEVVFLRGLRGRLLASLMGLATAFFALRRGR